MFCNYLRLPDEIKRCLLLGRKAVTNLDSILKSRDMTLPTEVHLVKAMFFSSSHVWILELDHKESWTPKNWCFWTYKSRFFAIIQSEVSKKERHYFANKGLYIESYGFSSSHVWMWELDHKQGRASKNWYFWTVVLEKTLESPLDYKEIKPVHPKGNQSWIFIGRTDAEAETLKLQYFGHLTWRTDSL